MTKLGNFIQGIVQHRLTKNSVLLGLVQVVNLAIPLAVMLRLTSVLGPENYGVVAFAMALVLMGAVVIDLGFSLSAVRQVAMLKDRPEAVASFVGAVYICKLAIFVVLAVGLAIYAGNTEKYAAYTPVFWLSILPLLGQALQPIWLFMGLEKMGLVVQVTLLARLIFGVLAFQLVDHPEDYYLVPMADGIGQILAGLYGLFLLYRFGGGIRWPAISQTRSVFEGTLSFFFSRLGVLTYQNTGVLMLGLVASPIHAGVFAIADQVYRGIQCIYAPIGQAVYPYMVVERDLKMYGRLVAVFAISSIVVALLVAVAAPLVVTHLIGGEWSDVIPTLNVFMVGIVITTLNVVSGYPLAAALDRVVVANQSVLIGSIVYVGLIAAILPTGRMTPPMLAAMVVAAELSVLIYRAFALWPSLRRRSELI